MSAFFVSPTPIISALRGFARAHSDRVALTEDPLFVRSRTQTPERRVGLVSGGGSGHEPMHVGFVGQGMLDAAVPGEVFASPHNAQIFAASRAVAGDDGVLHIVKNYTGDVINFAIAAERLQAAGIPTRTVIVDDDIATDSDETETGRRGTGATVIVEKILGAAADSGLGLDELADLGAEVVARSRSLAVAARAQTDSHTGRPAFDLAEGTLEYGVGIHGERAASSIGREDFDVLVARMVDEVHAAVAGDPADGDLLVFANGLGATTQIELFNVFDAVTRSLETKGSGSRRSRRQLRHRPRHDRLLDHAHSNAAAVVGLVGGRHLHCGLPRARRRRHIDRIRGRTRDRSGVAQTRPTRAPCAPGHRIAAPTSRPPSSSASPNSPKSITATSRDSTRSPVTATSATTSAAVSAMRPDSWRRPTRRDSPPPNVPSSTASAARAGLCSACSSRSSTPDTRSLGTTSTRGPSGSRRPRPARRRSAASAEPSPATGRSSTSSNRPPQR